MFNKIKAYIQSRRQRKWQVDGMSKMIEDTINDAYEAMSHQGLSIYGVQGYIRHLPVRRINDGYSDRIYEESMQCIKRLWNYSKEMSYIDQSISFETFIESGLDFSFFKS